MAERPLYTLYKNLKAQNYDVPNDYNKFESALTRDGKSGADNRHAIYENLKAQNFDVPDTYERFYTALFEPRSKTSSRAKGGSVPMSAADRARFLSGAAAISASAKQIANNDGRYNRLKQRKQKQQKDFGRVNLGTHLTPFGGDANNVVKDEFAYNPETGKAGAYVTSDNENAYTQSDAEQKQAILDKYGEEWNKAVDMGMVPSELDKADPDMSDTDVAMRQMERRQEWLDENQNRRSKELNESMHLQDSPFVASGGAVAPSSFNAAIGNEANRLSDAEYGAYNTAKAYNQMLRTTLLQELKEQKQRNENAGWWKDKWNDVSNYFGGMLDTMFDPKLYSQGVMDAAIASNLLQVKKGMEDGTIKKGSNAGNAAQVMLSAIQQQQGEAAKQQQYGTKAYQYGDVSGRSLKFMGDFALSGWRDVMTTGFTKAGEKVGEKMALGALGKWFTKNTGRVLGDMAGSAALAATNQLGSTYNNVIERYVGMNNENGGVTQDKDGDLSFNKGVSLGKAIKDGFGSATIENFSEMFGEYLPGASKLLSKLGLSKVSSFFEKIGNNAYYKWLSNATNKSGIQGVMAEISEEEFGTALHAAWGDGDGSWSDFNVFTNPDAREKQIDTCLGMFYSVGFMQSPRTAVGAINAVKYFNIKHQVSKADKFGQMMFNDKWDEIKNKIDVTTNADLTKTVLDATRSDSMNAKQKDAVINYAMFLSKLRGFNQASDAKTKDKVEEGETAPTLSNDLDDAYTEGHNSDDADKHDIQIQQEDQMKTLSALLGISEQQLSGMSDEEFESLTGQDDKLDQAIYDYQLSSARYQGVVDDAQDKVDLAAHQAAQKVDMYTDQSRGSVRNATIKASGGAEDYGVYIISGNIATNEDGSINVSGSDNMILYYDPTTDSVEHADALMFAELGEELPADDVKTQAVADAKENAIKEIAGIIDGTVDVGSQFTVTDADGTEHTYEVLADNGDGTAMITIDGNIPTELVKGETVQIPYPLADLQQMKDLEDQKRLEAAKAEREQMEKERAVQQTQEVEETQPSFDFNQILNDNGNVVLVDVLGKDGNTKYPDSKLFLIRDTGAKAKVVELKDDGTIVPHAVNKEDVATISSMSLDEYKQAMPESSKIEGNSGENRGGIEAEPTTIEDETTPDVAENTEATAPAEENAEEIEQAPAITLEDGTVVPMLEDGNPDFSKLSAAQTAELYDTQFDEDADGIVSGYVSDAKKALDKANNMTVKGKTFVEQKAAKAAKEKAIADAQAAYDSAVAIRDAYNERQLAKEENTPEGRKSLIEKTRRKYARLKNSEEWSERTGDLWNETVGKLLHRLYDATGIDVFNDTPNTVYEYVAANVGPYSLNFEGNDNSKGVQQETGLSRSDFAKLGWLAAEGKGMTIDAKVHRLWENRPSNLESSDTQEIRNALISLITSGQTAFQARDYILNQRIELAESALEEQRRQEEDAAEAQRVKEEEEKKKAELEKKTEEESKKAEEEKVEEEKTKDNENTEFSDNSKEESKTVEVPEDATDDAPLGEQLDESDLPFSAKDNGQQQTTSERDADVERNKVDDMKVVDNIVGQETRKAFERLAKMMGANIQWQYSDKLGNGWIQETTDADGNVHRTIFITLDSSITEGAQFIFGHEMTHQIKNLNPAAYNELTQLVLDTYGSDAFDKAVDETKKRYSDAGFSGRDRDYYAEEVVADAVGEMIRDLNLAHTLAMKMSHPLLAAIHEILQKIKLAFYGTEYSDVTKNIIRSIEQAYVMTAKGRVENSETGEDVSFSLRQKPEPKKKGVGYKVFGWGGYVTSSKKIGKSYAKIGQMSAEDRHRHASSEDTPIEAAVGSILGQEIYNERAKTFKQKKAQAIENAENSIASYSDMLKNSNELDEKSKKFLEKSIERYKKELEVLRALTEEQYKEEYIKQGRAKNLYEVDIPDDNGSNYLDWENPLNEEQINAIRDALAKNGVDVSSWENRGFKLDLPFKDVYAAVLPMMMRCEPKEVSKFLSSLGFTGIKYPAGTIQGGAEEGDTNYVIFKPEDMKITQHTKFSLRLKAAIEETETNPSDAQKESGNYKKGHIKFGGYDYTIENPKGSTRSGKDANGKEWKVTMHDTYGYIRGKFGKDGDHLDMFINDKADLDNWDGDVFVVDQVNPDGSFDEHKVMYGYDSMDDAEKAYLANYSKGWQGLGNITGASKTEFDKWLDTSNRKLKPFAEYSKVKFSQAQSVNNEEPKTFEEFLNHPSLKFSIKNEEQRNAAENAYEYAAKLRPNKYAQYAIVDMGMPSKVPEYYEKKVLADNWRRFYNRAVHNELNDVRKKAWGNYKLFDLDRPFADQVNEVKGNVPDEFDAPDAATNKDNIKGLDRQMSSVAETRYSLKDIKPIGVGAFGNIYNQFRGKSKAAIEFLKKLGSGEATAALHHHTIGDISLVWGDKKAGLDKILRKHPEVVDNLQSIIDSMEVVQESDNRVKLESPTHFAVISKEYKGEPREQWLLTAYEKRESLENDKSMDTATSSLGGDTALSQSKGSAAKIDNSSETAKENGEKFSLKDEKTLAGVHNITEEKLRKAIKQGGLANPSVAVIDSSKQNHEDYGDISLILSSDKVAKRTGKNAGTWQGDAWTPTYPQVERQMSNKGAEKASKDVSSVPGDMYREVRRGLDRWLDGGEANSAMAYMFLHEKGVAPEPKKIQHKFSDDVYNELKSITAGDFNIYGIGKADAQKVLGMYIDAKFDGDKDLYEEKTKAWLERNKSIVDAGNKGGMRYTIAKDNVELYDEYGFNYKSVQTFVRDVEYDHRKTGVDMNATLNDVEDYIKTNNQTDEFNTWLGGKEKEYGIKEVIFDGFTPSGNRRYVPNTLENVSKIMKKQGRNGATGISVSFQNFAASLMPSYGTLKDIRSKKGLLTSDYEDLDKFNEKWSKVFFELGMKCQPDATGTFDDYGLARLSEAAKTSDPQAYLKKEYNVDFSDEDTKRLKEMVKAIKEESPAMYFETKFERPVGFNEFSSAVVPTTASDEVKQALQKAGVQIYEYDKEKEGDRNRAFNEAINSSDNIRFSLKAMMEKPEGWKQANKKAIHIAEAIERDPKFSLKNLDGTLIKAGTYFSGGGLVEEGLKGIIDPVVAVEYDEKISGVYRNNFGLHIVTADVRDVDPKELVKQIDGEVEYFHASPVCKNYSQAKSNHAEVELDKETAASTAEFINAIKPKVVTIENVKGYKDSEAMKTITDALDANDYTWDADVYNAADYGGYTNRERLIVRAVRDGKLPEKPKKMARKSGWYEAVEDIIPTLTEKKNGVAPWMDVRLKADGIDWRNIDKPLYVMGSAYADGKVPHAFADELLPTLRTKSGDVIVMPGGKVYRAMGRVLARVSGVSDDYKMPFSENLSHTIIGNGIPTQLTEHVIAPLLQNTLRPTTPEDGNTKFSLRYDQFEHDLNQWKKDNNLPKDAKRPTIPQRNAGESAVDFLKRVDEYRKQMALWKTAPTYEQHLLSDDTALGEFNRELQRGSVLKRIAFQDSMLAIRKAQEAIMKEVGVDRLNMAEDAYTAENRSHGKGKNEFEEYNNEFLQPLRKAYHQMKKVLGDSYDNVRLYMMAKHGLERNAQMAFKKSLEADYEDVAQRSAAYKAYKGDIKRMGNDSGFELGLIDYATWVREDNAIKMKYSPSYMKYRYDKMGIAFDYSGLSALFDGSDFEEAAHKLVRDIESKHIVETKELWDATNAATKKILRDGYKAGMMSEDTYQYVRDMYSHYIPLRGWDGTTADQVWDYVGGGNGAFNQTLKTAHGRTSIADDPIAYIENMAESGILLNNKNWVKQHLMLLAQNHPTSLLTLSKAWYVKSTDANGNEEWIPATPQITSQMNSNQVKAAIDAFDEKMEQMEQTGDATQKRDGLNIAFPQTYSEEREHEVRVMKDGEEYVIYVNGDPQLAQAMNNTRAHRVREIQSGKLDRAAAWLGRKMAAAYTSLSPLFIPSNYFRDLTMTLASTAIREDGRYNYLLRKNLATSWNLGFMLRDYQNGKLREKVNNGNATPKEQMFYDFLMNGGETGFVSSLDVDDLKKKFKNDLKDLNRWKANPVKVGHTIMDGIEFLNRAIEDSNRFAIYMTSIQYGRSIDEAVNDAKDVTLNFNRKGTGEYGWQMIRNLYLFINPAVQSLQTLGALVKHHPFKFTAVTASWLASGVLVPIVNAALMSLLGGDDDKDKYWQFTKWDRRNNLIMWVPFTHEYIKIPLAQEFRAFYGVGDMIASKMMGGELAEESWSQYAEDLLGQVVDMLPLDPTGYDGNIAVSLMPNAIRPVFELAFNVDFTGKPLFKDTEYNKYDPNFTKAYVGTPDWLVRVSKMVNSIGNDYPDVQQNSIDAFGDPRYNLNNPGVVDHILSSYLGGAYTMGSQVLGVLTKLLNDPKEIKVADIPLFSKFVSNPDDRPVTKKQGDEFWDMKENHDRAANTLSKLKKQAKVDGDYSMLERFYGSEEYKQYKQDDAKVKKYEEDKKKERAEESGEEYRPHKLNAEDIYKAHATPKDDFEDLKLKQLYTKLNGFKSTYDLLVDTAPSQSDGYYNTNKAVIDAIDEVSLDKQEISELKKGFLDDGKDAYNAEDMKRIRELRKKVLAVLEKANKVVVANKKAKKK